MANVKISDLTPASSVVGTQEFETNEAGTSKKVTASQFLAYTKANTTPADLGAVATSDIGSTVQAYDANTVKKNVENTFTDAQRGAVTTDNDLSFDMNVGNNFTCTPTGTGALTFTNITAGQSGYVYIDNTGGYAITKAASVLAGATFLSTVSAAGKYIVSYYAPNTSNVIVTSSQAVS